MAVAWFGLGSQAFPWAGLLLSVFVGLADGTKRYPMVAASICVWGWSGDAEVLMIILPPATR